MVPNFAKSLKGKKLKWYQTEKNTAALLQAVVSAKNVDLISGDDIWHLLRLTWFTKRKTGDHWRSLKVPALCHLFPPKKKIATSKTTLQDKLDTLPLPKNVAVTAATNTGNIGFWRAYWSSSKVWCKNHAPELREIIEQAIHLSNDKERFALAEKIDRLPKIPTPNGINHKNPGDLLTPLVAFLDPHCRFPIVNQKKGVQALLREYQLHGRNLKEQVRGLMGLIGPRYGISNAFMLDVCAAEIKANAIKLNTPLKLNDPTGSGILVPGSHSDLPDFDVSEREYFREAGTIRYRNRHNKMTEALKKILQGFTLRQGTNPSCRWDVLVERYDTTGRNLLLELKPDAEKAAIRIAIGQLLDYRRFVVRPVATDIAILTIGPPEKAYRQLLSELEISVIWFTNEDCRTLNGEGSYWEALQESLTKSIATRSSK